MREAIDQFVANVARVRDLGSLVDTLQAQTTGALDLSDILRAELVLSVSALDHYVHEVVRLGMIEAYRGTRQKTQQFLDFQVSLSSALSSVSGGAAWIDNEVRVRNGFRSFQTPDNIAAAIRLISGIRLWDQVAQRMNRPVRDIRDTLSVIVDRRNKIAHEADMNPSPYVQRYSINKREVNDAVDFIEQVVRAIHASL